MTFQKQQQYDPAEAFIKNAREQKLLDLKIEEIDKLWLAQLKRLAKERLDVTSELTKFEEVKRQLDHFDEHMDIHEIKPYSNEVWKQLRTLKRETSRDNFNFDEVKHRRESIVAASSASIQSVPLPRLERQMSKCCLVSTKNKPVKHTNKQHSKRKRKSKLKASRVISLSDSNLHTQSKYSDETEIVTSEHDGNRNTDVTSLSTFSREVFPQIQNRLAIVGNDDYRYLKHRMATALVLPPLSEVSVPTRKLSL